MMNKPLTFGSLFAGIGGLDLGFERAGLQCKWQVEIDPCARQVLAKHWPEVPRHDDIRTFTSAPCVDIVAGGFPCQDISYAGKGAGLAGERSGLFYELIRVVREVEPRIVVLENVAALLTRGLGDVLGTLASIGFDAEWHCIPAAAVGAPHIRDRIFVLAYAKLSEGSERRGPTVQRRRANEAEQARMGSGNDADANGRRLQGSKERNGKSQAWLNAQHRDNALRCGLPGPWAIEPAVGRVADGVPARVDRLRGLGNAIVPQVAEWIGRRIVAATENNQ